MKTLFLIPARGGSKGIPHKNIKLMCGKPLIHYSIDLARKLASDEDICISTDDPEIKKVAEGTGITVPFLRPTAFATDYAGTNEVILHALEFYKGRGVYYDRTVLLQPTSPMRTVSQVKEAMALYNDRIDMVVSVREYEKSVVLFRESEDGFLRHVIDVSAGIRRQDAEVLYEYNGAIYVINNQALQEKGLAGFRKNKKYVMPEEDSIDIDTNGDGNICWRKSLNTIKTKKP